MYACGTEPRRPPLNCMQPGSAKHAMRNELCGCKRQRDTEVARWAAHNNAPHRNAPRRTDTHTHTATRTHTHRNHTRRRTGPPRRALQHTGRAPRNPAPRRIALRCAALRCACEAGTINHTETIRQYERAPHAPTTHTPHGQPAANAAFVRWGWTDTSPAHAPVAIAVCPKVQRAMAWNGDDVGVHAGHNIYIHSV